MTQLLVVSLVWAFSFGLIKDNLTGINANFVACARLFLSLLIFLPFLRIKKISIRMAAQFIGTGAVQFGLMYIAYIYSFKYLQSYEVALFTLFTPLYVTLINNYLQKHFYRLNLVTSLMAIIGTGIVVQSAGLRNNILIGFLIVQVSNLCFAFGQVYYRTILTPTPGVKDQDIFGWLYFGGFLMTAITTTLFNGWKNLNISSQQWITLVYLGVIASGVGFFLWNYGARRVNAGALAIFNNLKVPLAVTVSLLVFHESTDVPRLVTGGGIVLIALLINEWVINREKTRVARVGFEPTSKGL
jgi:drug/metabolite transporter (DMT)-like permease